MLGYLLAISAALSFAAVDAGRKMMGQHLGPLALTAWIALASLPFLLVWAAWTGWAIHGEWWRFGLASVAIQGAASFLFLWALKIAPLSRTIPFLSLTPVLSGLAAWIGLQETPSPVEGAGMILVTTGAFVLATSRGHEPPPSKVASWSVEPGSILASLVAVLWSVGAVVDKVALVHAEASSHAVAVTLGIAVVFVAERWMRGGLSSLSLRKEAVGKLCLVAAVGALAMGLQLLALERISVSFVETIKRAMGGVASLLLGRVLFDERISPGMVLGVVLMTAGTILVLL